MRNFLASIFEYTPCLCCGSWLIHRFHLCLSCHNYIFSSSSKITEQSLFKSLYFFSTTKPEVQSESRDVVEKLILQLKSCSDLKRFKFFSELCFNDERIYSEITNLENPIVVYPPSTRFGNHAKAMAGAVAKQFLLKTADVFVATGHQKKSKFSNKHERQKIEYSLKEDFICQKDQHFIAVDDLQTTGSTLKACYIALGSPRNFIAITLAHRLSTVETLSLK